MPLCENGKRVTVEVGSHVVFGGGVRGGGVRGVCSVVRGGGGGGGVIGHAVRMVGGASVWRELSPLKRLALRRGELGKLQQTEVERV